MEGVPRLSSEISPEASITQQLLIFACLQNKVTRMSMSANSVSTVLALLEHNCSGLWVSVWLNMGNKHQKNNS